MSCRHSGNECRGNSGNEPQAETGLFVRGCVALLKSYKRFVSPFLPPSCRYTPTCSEYAVEAVRRYGVFRGLMLSLFRLLRCHPFAKGGYDPVK